MSFLPINRLTSALAACALVVMAIATSSTTADAKRWGRDYFPNVVLTDQNGQQLRFVLYFQ